MKQSVSKENRNTYVRLAAEIDHCAPPPPRPRLYDNMYGARSLESSEPPPTCGIQSYVSEQSLPQYLPLYKLRNIPLYLLRYLVALVRRDLLC